MEKYKKQWKDQARRNHWEVALQKREGCIQLIATSCLRSSSTFDCPLKRVWCFDLAVEHRGG